MAGRQASYPVRIALLGDCTAVREGLAAVISAEPDLEVAGVAASEWQFRPLLLRTRPDVVVVNLHQRSLAASFEITRRPHAPALVLYTATLDDGVVVAAALAGVGAVVKKPSPAAALLDAVRELARSPRALPCIPRWTRREVGAHLDPADRAILAMRLAGDRPAKIARALGMQPATVIGRIAKMIARLDRTKGLA
jgi:DNA-binding NarL/FixJ family response regulator